MLIIMPYVDLKNVKTNVFIVQNVVHKLKCDITGTINKFNCMYIYDLHLMCLGLRLERVLTVSVARGIARYLIVASDVAKQFM
jgi:hypothetical protein